MGKFQNFFLKQALKRKLDNVPEAQKNMIMNMVENNPEFFKKIGEEIEKKKKIGMDEMAATMQVMREHQAEFQKLMK